MTAWLDLARNRIDDPVALPALYTDLARAYEGLQDARLAAQAYRSAADLYASQGRLKRAELVLAEARRLAN